VASRAGASARSASDSVEFSLLENGVDFIAKALDELRGDPSARNLKYGVLHLKSGLDLILKERLRMHDWRQLFDDTSLAEEGLFESGEFVSPRTREVLRRLREEAGVTITSRQKRNIERLRRLRNRIEHFAITDSATTVVAVTSLTLAFALDFVGAQIEPMGIAGRAAQDLERIRNGLNDFSAFVDDRWRAIGPELARFDAVLDCYRCGERAFALELGAVCHFCGYHVEAEEGAAQYAWLVLGSTEYDTTKGGDWAVDRCHECDAEARVDTGDVGAEKPVLRWACFECGRGWNDDALKSCSTCGRLHDGDLDICSDCWEYRISGDD
jgi:ribosomal protein L37E